jgi:hypothetical protein
MLGSFCILTAATNIPLTHTFLRVSWISAAVSLILWTLLIAANCESGDRSSDGT